MKKKEAIAIADAFIREQMGPDPRFLGDRLDCSFREARKHDHREWSVVYERVLPDQPGSVIDGPIIVIVDSVTQKARFFNTL